MHESTSGSEHGPEGATHVAAAARWRPLSAIDRRVVGVLAEKAKTTPDAYPMTLNALRTGCNQKSNRFPMMEAEIEDVEESLERLRAGGAVSEIQGGGRTAKYRHLLYDWLGVDKVELAVMTELLLRGAQTEGELRGRAARMEPIADLAALRPVLASLQSKKLVLSLTPAGRGHVITHALYEERELEKLRREFAHGHVPQHDGDAEDDDAHEEPALRRVEGPALSRVEGSRAVSRAPSSETSSATQAAIETLRSEMADMQAELARLRRDVDDLRTQLS